MYFINLDRETDQRYNMAKFLKWDEFRHDVLNSEFVKELRKLPHHGKWKVKQAERPTLIAFELYGKIDLWWIIMMYNDLIHINDIQLGMTLRYPSLNSVENLYLSLNSKQRAASN